MCRPKTETAQLVESVARVVGVEVAVGAFQLQAKALEAVGQEMIIQVVVLMDLQGYLVADHAARRVRYMAIIF